MIFRCDFMTNAKFIRTVEREIEAKEIDVSGIPMRLFKARIDGHKVKFEVGFDGPLVVNVACREPARTVFIIWMVQHFRDALVTGMAQTSASATKITIRPGESLRSMLD